MHIFIIIAEFVLSQLQRVNCENKLKQYKIAGNN